MQIVDCATCGTRVVPKVDGTCPGCRSMVAEPVEAVSLADSAFEAEVPAEQPIEVTSNEPLFVVDSDAGENAFPIVTEEMGYARQTMRESLSSLDLLRWVTLFAFLAVPLSGSTGAKWTVLIVLTVGTRGVQTLSKTKIKTEVEIGVIREKFIFWMSLGIIPGVVWFLGYFVWEGGFARFYPSSWDWIR